MGRTVLVLLGFGGLAYASGLVRWRAPAGFSVRRGGWFLVVAALRLRLRAPSDHRGSPPDEAASRGQAHGRMPPAARRLPLDKSNYQAGISVVDFTNPAAAKEIAYADPAPLVPTQLGGDWSTYWYNGRIYELANEQRRFRMAAAPYRVAHVSEIVTPLAEEPGNASWRAVRRHFDIGSFGVAAYTGRAAGDVLSGDHAEADTRHEELFFVAAGHAAIRVGEETVDAPAGTFVYVSDPEVVRGATALAPDTTLLAVGGEPGKAFEVSSWEKQYAGDE